jgi:hypothetical protein
MAQNSLTHRGTTTGYVSNGPEITADAGQPKAGGTAGGAQLREPFRPPAGPAAKPPQARRSGKAQERPEMPDDESPADDDAWRWTATVVAPGPAYSGAAWNGGGGALANAISFGDAPKAIGSGAGKVIEGALEDLI